MHKVGRYLTKILGGLCLVAGVAAAVAATVASCGIGGAVLAGAAGILTGTLGITGTSVLAGAAGATGIGLLVGSSKMKPTDPKALLQPQQAAQGKVALPKMGPDETNAIEKALKTKYDTEPALIQSGSNVGEKIGKLVESIEGEPVYEVDKSLAKPDDIKSCVKGILSENGIQKLEVNEKNMLLVRHAIDNYLNESVDIDVNAWNHADVKNGFNTIAENAMKKLSPNSDDYKLLAIFKGALNLESVDIPKPQPQNVAPNPLIQGGADLKDIKTVSMGQQVTFGMGAEQKIHQSIKTLDPNIPDKIWNGGVDEMIAAIESMTMTDKEVTYLATDYLADFTKYALDNNDIKNFDLTPKNVLIVRHAFAEYYNDYIKDYPDALKKFNNADGQKQISAYITKEMNDLAPDSERYKLLALFRAAISQTDLTELNTNADLVNAQRNVIQG